MRLAVLQSHTVETGAQELAAIVLASAVLATERASADDGCLPVFQIRLASPAAERTFWEQQRVPTSCPRSRRPPGAGGSISSCSAARTVGHFGLSTETRQGRQHVQILQVRARDCPDLDGTRPKDLVSRIPSDRS